MKYRTGPLHRSGKHGDFYWYTTYAGDFNLRVRDTFRSVVKLKYDKNYQAEVEERRFVNLKIKALSEYGKNCDFVLSGHSCGIAFEGPDLEWLNQDWCVDCSDVTGPEFTMVPITREVAEIILAALVPGEGESFITREGYEKVEKLIKSYCHNILTD